MAGEADHGSLADLRIHRGAAFRWRMLNRHAHDSEITTGCRISRPAAVGGARAGRGVRRRGPCRCMHSRRDVSVASKPARVLLRTRRPSGRPASTPTADRTWWCRLTVGWPLMFLRAC
jgi:hypothetical protein